MPASAQTPTNAAIYSDQAISCLIAVPDTAHTFVLQSPGVMSFLETALVARWTESGRSVYRTDSVLVHPLPALTYDIEEANVSYARARRKRFARSVSLGLRFSWVTRTGQMLRSEHCTRTSDDFILRSEVTTVESPSYSQTVATLPPASWTRRYLEPLALGAATVLTVFLFFNLRSSSAPSGG